VHARCIRWSKHAYLPVNVSVIVALIQIEHTEAEVHARCIRWSKHAYLPVNVSVIVALIQIESANPQGYRRVKTTNEDINVRTREVYQPPQPITVHACNTSLYSSYTKTHMHSHNHVIDVECTGIHTSTHTRHSLTRRTPGR